MATPISAELATRWIEDGTAEKILDSRQAEAISNGKAWTPFDIGNAWMSSYLVDAAGTLAGDGLHQGSETPGHRDRTGRNFRSRSFQRPACCAYLHRHAALAKETRLRPGRSR